MKPRGFSANSVDAGRPGRGDQERARVDTAVCAAEEMRRDWTWRSVKRWESGHDMTSIDYEAHELQQLQR